jgi:hypothetical protein
VWGVWGVVVWWWWVVGFDFATFRQCFLTFQSRNIEKMTTSFLSIYYSSSVAVSEPGAIDMVVLSQLPFCRALCPSLSLVPSIHQLQRQFYRHWGPLNTLDVFIYQKMRQVLTFFSCQVINTTSMISTWQMSSLENLGQRPP